MRRAHRDPQRAGLRCGAGRPGPAAGRLHPRRPDRRALRGRLARTGGRHRDRRPRAGAAAGALRHARPSVQLGRGAADRGGVTTVRDMGNDNALLAGLSRRIAAASRSARESWRPASSRARASSRPSGGIHRLGPGGRQAGDRLVCPAGLSADQALQLVPARVGAGGRQRTRTSAACGSVGTSPPSCGPRMWCGRASTRSSTSTRCCSTSWSSRRTTRGPTCPLHPGRGGCPSTRLQASATVQEFAGPAEPGSDGHRSHADSLRRLVHPEAGRAGPRLRRDRRSLCPPRRQRSSAPIRRTSTRTTSSATAIPLPGWSNSSASCTAQGIPLVAGTDAMAGFTLHRELELYAQPASRRPRSCGSPPGTARSTRARSTGWARSRRASWPT